MGLNEVLSGLFQFFDKLINQYVKTHSKAVFFDFNFSFFFSIWIFEKNPNN